MNIKKNETVVRILKCMVLLLLLPALLAGCSGKGEKAENGGTAGVLTELKVADYFPISEDRIYIYGGQGNEFSGFEVYVEYTSEDRVQQRIDNGGAVLTRVYKVKAGKVTRVLSKGETYYRENMLQKSDGAGEVLLMEPLKKGTSWTLKDGSQRTITGTSTKVETPMGTFPCIEVITEGGSGTTIDYYAKDIGLIKTIFQSGGMEVSTALKSIETNGSRTENIRFYYPDLQSGRIYYQEREVTWRTNDDTAKILENAYKSAADETFGTVIPTGAAIKSLISDDENKVRLDLNAAFITDMKGNAADEKLILQCIADTFGNYFHLDEVILTVEGKPYESANVKMKEDQPIPVKLEGITEKGGSSARSQV